MAGLSPRGTVVIDVAAAARKLLVSASDFFPPAPNVLEPRSAPPVQEAPAACGFGHSNDAGAKFCATCGLPIGVSAPVQRVNLDEERARLAMQVSEQDKEERARQHTAALAAAAAFEQAPAVLPPATGTERILVHFVQDGFTFAGRVWYRGQELEIGPEHPRWRDVLGWIMLTSREQHERYGRQFFERGPWPGRQPEPGSVATLETAGADRWASADRARVPAVPGEAGALVPL